MTLGAPQSPEFWQHPSIVAALEAQHAGRLVRAYRLHPAHGRRITQEAMGLHLGYAGGNADVHRLEQKKVTDLGRLTHLFAALAVPRDLWWFASAPTDDEALTYHPSLATTLDTVADLGRDDMKRRGFLKSALFAVGAAAGPSRDWLVATLEEAAVPHGRVGAGQVAAIRRTFSAFQDMDVMRGGGFARHRLAAFLTDTVVPLLRANDPETETGRALFEAGAEQYYLLGWMAYDDGHHALAQRYLIQALRLAQAARSPELGAHILAGLADQATLTGHPADGLQFARAGKLGLSKGHSPACLADLLALQARASAAMGEEQATITAVEESRSRFAEVRHDEEPAWAKFIDVAYLNGEYANAFDDLGDAARSRTFAEVSATDAARQGRGRRGSLAHSTLARAALVEHDLPAAATAGMETVRLAATVDSSRSREAVTDLCSRLRRHRRSSVHVAEFFDVADALGSSPQ